MILIAIICWLVVFYMLLGEAYKLSSPLLTGLLALFGAISFTSFSFIISVFFHIPFNGFQLTFLGLALLFLGIRRRYLIANWEKIRSHERTISDGLFTLVLVCILIFSWLFFYQIKKWGDVDAVAMWTVHAKFFVDEEAFVNLFKEIRGHPDYPLMLPAMIASIWKSLGNQSHWVPILIAYVSSLALVFLLVFALIRHEKLKFALAALLLTTCTGMVYEYGKSLYADTLLAAFMLIPFVLLSLLPEKSNRSSFMLLGFFAASCGWIKNEGLVFFLIFSVMLLLRYRKDLPQYLYYLLGTAFPIIMILWFKIQYAPENDLFFLQEKGALIDRVLDISRYLKIISWYFSTLLLKFPLVIALFVILLISNYKHSLNFNFLILYALLAIFFWVYLTTPYDLHWHLKSSFTRLFYQMMPAILFTIFMLSDEKQLLWASSKKSD